MDTEAGGDRAAQDSVQSVSGVTEAGTSSNAASGEKQARRRGGLDAGLLTVVERAAVDDGVGWEVGEVTTAAGDDNEEAAACSTARRTAARLGWLLLGFVAGTAVAAAALFLMRHESPVTCTVVPT